MWKTISDIRQQVKQAKLDEEALCKGADEYAVKAENERNISHIAKSNCMREKAKEKAALCIKLQSKVDRKLKELKDI